MKGLFLGVAMAQVQDEMTEAPEKIVIDLYFESECPACRNTITQNFAEAYRKHPCSKRRISVASSQEDLRQRSPEMLLLQRLSDQRYPLAE